MRNKHAFLFSALAVILVLAAFSCSDSTDNRNKIVTELGPPDSLQQQDFGYFRMERYIYAAADINRVYEFRQNKGGCGGSGQWYLFIVTYADMFMDLYIPPEITHEQIKTAPANTPLEISANVTDDQEVISVFLFFRVTGGEFESLDMFLSDGLYRTTIPADSMTIAGIEYYIQATDNDDHTRAFPRTGAFKVKVTGTAKVTLGEMGTSNIDHEGFLGIGETSSDRMSPLSQ